MINPLMDGFTIPFEGNEHNGTIIMLPYRADTWASAGAVARNTFKEIIYAIAEFEMVYVVSDPSIYNQVKDDYENKNNITLWQIPYDDSWARDIAPIFVSDGKYIRAVDFGFNAWGGSVDGLYQSYDNDNQFRKAIASKLNCQLYQDKEFILEGGSIHTDGRQTLLVTEACLLSKGRNHSLSKQEIEEHLLKMLGMKQVIWIPNGIVNDETNEHIDNMACFLDEKTIALAYTEADSLQYEYSKKAYEILSKATNIFGEKYKIVKMPLPNPPLYLTNSEAQAIEGGNAISRLENNRLAASYINFYQGKDFVILPQFGVKEDKEAYQILKDFYPHKRIIPIMSRSILTAGGNIHCITMQICKGEYENEN